MLFLALVFTLARVKGIEGRGCKAKAGKKGKEGHPLWDTAVPRPGDFRVSRRNFQMLLPKETANRHKMGGGALSAS